MAAMLFHILQKNHLKKVAHFSVVYYHIQLQDHILNYADVSPTSQVHSFTKLSLLIKRN
jgi:hypothetical protein